MRILQKKKIRNTLTDFPRKIFYNFKNLFKLSFCIFSKFSADLLKIFLVIFSKSSSLSQKSYKFTHQSLYEVHFKSSAHSGTKPSQCALKKYQHILCRLPNTPVYDLLQCSANMCVYCMQNVDMTDTSGHVTKQDQKIVCENQNITRPLF